MIYYTGFEEKSRNTAGGKAPADIKELCRRREYNFVKILHPPERLPDALQKVWKFHFALKYWNFLKNTLRSGDVFIYQHPLYIKVIASRYISALKAKGVKLVVLIHDLETLRKGIDGFIKESKVNEEVELTLFKQFDIVICHNGKMKQFLLEQGFDEKQLVCLEIFDYLGDAVCPTHTKGEKPSIAIAGSLHKGKCGYIYKILDGVHNQNLHVDLFGNFFEETEASKQLEYHGSFSPEELPKYLTSDFGLVWDGTEVETCAGNTGEYLKFNNPHKTSLYLSSQLPVIVWSQAAIADFVLKNNVGIAVNSLYELEDAISAVSQEEYSRMSRNTRKVSDQLHNGYYFYRALDEGLRRIQEE